MCQNHLETNPLSCFAKSTGWYLINATLHDNSLAFLTRVLYRHCCEKSNIILNRGLERQF